MVEASFGWGYKTSDQLVPFPWFHGWTKGPEVLLPTSLHVRREKGKENPKTPMFSLLGKDNPIELVQVQQSCHSCVAL